MSSTHAPTRRGSILALAFFVIALVASLLLVTSDEVFGVNKLQVIGRAKQKATYAAESIAASREADMVAIAAQNDLAAMDTRPNPNFGTQWFNDCVVRWRIEPVRLANTDAAGGETDYTVNPLANPGTNPPGSYRNNQSFYSYRIATEAWALRDPSIANQQPWANPGMAIARVRASRVVVINLVSLFRYAIFYAAPSPVGDLEMWAGANITVNGSVHSNGAIFIGGGSANYANAPIGTNRYHDSASGRGAVTIGGALGGQVPIVGVDGLYRMRKGANLVATANGVTGASANPRLVPREGDAGVGAGELNLNGDTPGSTLHNFNGQAFNSANDSRSTTMQARWAGFVRDRFTGGATIVRTLSNIPDLDGRPFEANRSAPEARPLYTTSADPNDRAGLTNSGTGARQVYHRTTTTPTTLTDDPALGVGGPASTSEMPLFNQGGSVCSVRVPTTQALLLDGNPAGATPAQADTFLTRAQFADPGSYLGKALNGTDGQRTGLAIRERGAQNTAWRWTDVGGTQQTASVLRPAPPAAGATQVQITNFIRSYTTWMKSQFVVLYQGADITDRFFSFNEIAAAPVAGPDLTRLNATSDDILNRRESFFLQLNGYLPGPLDPRFDNYRVNVLTLRWANIQAFLLTTPRSLLQPGWPGITMANSGFNGLVYAHRTPRLRDAAGIYRYHPLTPFGYDAVTRSQSQADLLQTTFAATPFLPLPARPNFLNAVPIYNPIDGATDIGTQPHTIPFHSAIRVTQAGTINHGVMNPLNPTRLLGLTIVTPNLCYLQGDYNLQRYAGTTPDPGGQLPPCAVFADGLTALSNNWQDALNQRYSDPLRIAAATTFNLSLIINNVPTTRQNAPFEGSGAVSNTVKFLEDWGGRTYTFMGSLVVMNQSRYTRGDLGANIGAPAARSFYSPPARVLNFNTDLLTGAGQPPFTPYGVNVVRAISTVHVVE